jgi:hypothetical protein
VSVPSEFRVVQLKDRIQSLHAEFKIAAQALVMPPDTCLDNSLPLSHYGLQHESVVHLVINELASHSKYCVRVAHVDFPPYTGVVCNMMPIVLGDHDTIPVEFRAYAPLIDACECEQTGRVVYLTVHESVIGDEAASQRRPGLHTESPCIQDSVGWGGGRMRGPHDRPKGRGERELIGGDPDVFESWRREGGIYMASTVADSCLVYDANATACGSLGDVESDRSKFGTGLTMGAGELWWMTDRTPHESLVLPPHTQRQYFRLVTNRVSRWYSRHSTANPLGVVANCHITDVDKFAEAEAMSRKLGRSRV